MSNPDYLISTPENVDLHLELAGIGNRVLACLIDTAITFAMITALAAVLWGVWIAISLAGLPSSTQALVAAVILMGFVLLSFFIWFGYFIMFEGFWQGQTPGKKLVNIRVIEQNGQPVSWGAVLFRNFMRFLDEGVILIGLLIMFIDRNERRIGDLAAGTLVIRERLSELPTQEIVPATGSELAVTIDAGSISPQEYDLLVNFLRRRGTLAKSQRPLVAQELAKYFREKLSEPIEKSSAGEAEPFLERVYSAYRSRAEA